MTRQMPVLFIGHGNPMHALAHNRFTEALSSLGQRLPRPRAVLCVSAHWMTKGTWVTGMDRPKTIHDFHGFPRELFEVQYPAPGEPQLASMLHESFMNPPIAKDGGSWGLDHGTWAVLRHIYPAADVPVVQISIAIKESPQYQYDLGLQLRALRKQGVLIVGSGNIVHNLRTIRWEEDAQAYDWARDFDAWVKERILAGDHRALIEDFLKTEAGRLSVPTMDHYYPLLTVIGAAESTDQPQFVFEGLENGSISMRSLLLG